MLHRCVPRNVHDAQRQRELFSADPSRFALAIPPFREGAEQIANIRGVAEAVGQHLRHLAQGRDVGLVPTDGSREAGHRA
jgi:hypothetical protein